MKFAHSRLARIFGGRVNRRHSRKLLAVIGLVAAAAVLAGCASSAPSASPAATKVKLGIVGYSSADATLNETAQEIVKQAKALGWATDYQAVSPAGDVTAANALMQVMVNKGDTMLITIAFDPHQLATGIAAAHSKHVPVLAMSAGELAKNVIWASNVGYIPAYGTLIKHDLASAKSVEMLNLTYLLATPGVGRNKLIQQIAKADPRIHMTNDEVLIPGAIQSGQQFTTAWLAAHPAQPGVKYVIYAVFDQPAQGAVAALKQAGRTDVSIYSYDATPQGLALVESGAIRADIQNGRKVQATQVIKAAEQVAEGKLTKPELVPAAYYIVTTDNVKAYKQKFPAAFTAAGI